MLRSLPMLRRCSLFVVALASLLFGCEAFDSPPQPSLPGAVDGIITDPTAPLVVSFHEPIVASTLSLKVVRVDEDNEGNLLDEVGGELEVLFSTDPVDGDEGGEGELDSARRVYTMNLSTTMPIGPDLAVIIEPGLSDDAGNVWNVRQILKFGFQFTCGDDSGSEIFGDGVYFFKVQVEAPISVQILLLGSIDVNEETGNFIGQFTNADRNLGLDCGMSCDDGQVCRLLPEPSCVLPSEPAGSADEYPDFGPNPDPPTGYSFTVRGCVKDQDDGSVAFANAPADVQVQSPAVTVKGINLSSGFRLDDQGVLRGQGIFTAEQVSLGPIESGTGTGQHTERLIPPDEVPEGVPTPPAE